MRKLIAITSSLLLSITINAQVISTLHHNGVTTVYYNQNGLADAYNSAVAGDTIYLLGGHFNPVTINKRITVFGAGHYPDSTGATNVTYIDGPFSIGEFADSVRIEGLRIGGTLTITSDQSVNHALIKRNYIAGNLDVGGSRTNPTMFMVFTGNVVNGWLYGSNMLQCDISNNIFNAPIASLYMCSFRNNVVTSWSWAGWPYYTDYVMNDCDNCLIENNVFTSRSVLLQCDNSIARFNVFEGTPSNVSGTTNFVSNYPTVSMASYFINFTSTNFTYTDNYHLQTPSSYLGSDATQTGIYGGARPYKEAAVPTNPHIRAVNVPATTDVNGNLNINVQAGAQQQ